MKIEQDELINNKNSGDKIVKILSILIVITILIVIGILILMASMREKKMTLTVDGVSTAFTDDTFLFAEETGEIYISIKDIAPLVGYEAHNR